MYIYLNIPIYYISIYLYLSIYLSIYLYIYVQIIEGESITINLQILQMSKLY